jgi:transposase
MRKFTQENRDRIISLLRLGNSTRTVSKDTGASQSSVAQLRRQHMDNQSPLSAGRPRVLSSRHEREIARSAASGKLLTAVDVQKYIEKSEFSSICANTVRRSLRRSGLKARV